MKGHNGFFDPWPLRAFQKGTSFRALGPSCWSVSLKVRTFVGLSVSSAARMIEKLRQREVEAPRRTVSCAGALLAVHKKGAPSSPSVSQSAGLAPPICTRPWTTLHVPKVSSSLLFQPALELEEGCSVIQPSLRADCSMLQEVHPIGCCVVRHAAHQQSTPSSGFV